MTGTNGFLLDTMVISEPRRPRPDLRVLQFFSTNQNREMFLSVMTLAELRRGAEKLGASSEKRLELGLWIDGLESTAFEGRVVGIDRKVAALWAKLSAQRSRPIIDTFLAATAIVHDLTLVTRNERDFRDIPLKLLNPWEA